jgi:glycosyltransferase involved in cell wall biosynthesis
MKILILNTYDIKGGAARAAYRLHKALLVIGIDSQMLVQSKSSEDYTIISAERKLYKLLNTLRPILDSVINLFYRNRTRTHFSSALLPSGNIVKRINKINPDIVHLHWICGGMIRIEDLARINAPIVWSLHDMWAFTGGCHYDEECKGYENKCGNCKVLSSKRSFDLSSIIFNRKQKAFSKIENITVVGLSKWLNDSSKNSPLLKDKTHINLPNPIDTNIYRPFDKNKSRELWNLPSNKKLVLYGAMKSTSDPRKGFVELSQALNNLNRKDVEFVVFGSDKPKKSQEYGFKTHYLGNLSDDISLVTLYSAVDVMIVPSLQENLSNSIMESLSCGTPVVAFNIGGNSDMIKHKYCGYLANSFLSADLAHGIEWVLDNSKKYDLSNNSRDHIIANFDSKLVASKYHELYRKILCQA